MTEDVKASDGNVYEIIRRVPPGDLEDFTWFCKKSIEDGFLKTFTTNGGSQSQIFILYASALDYVKPIDFSIRRLFPHVLGG